LAAAPALAADTIKGQVLGAGSPIAGAKVTLWAAGVGAPPTQLAQTQTIADGRFELNAGSKSGDLYIVANGGHAVANASGGENAAIALMTVLGADAPENVVINEMTTIASVFTHNQFIDGAAIKGPGSTHAEVAVRNNRTLRCGNGRSVAVAEHLIAALTQCRIAGSWGKDPGLRRGATLPLDPVDAGPAASVRSRARFQRFSARSTGAWHQCSATGGGPCRRRIAPEAETRVAAAGWQKQRPGHVGVEDRGISSRRFLVKMLARGSSCLVAEPRVTLQLPLAQWPRRRW
jgi:hypothetical protein